LYIVLFKPEKNTKEVVMSQHRSSSYLATPTPTNATPVAVVVNGMCPHYTATLSSGLQDSVIIGT